MTMAKKNIARPLNTIEIQSHADVDDVSNRLTLSEIGSGVRLVFKCLKKKTVKPGVD